MISSTSSQQALEPLNPVEGSQCVGIIDVGDDGSTELCWAAICSVAVLVLNTGAAAGVGWAVSSSMLLKSRVENSLLCRCMK